MQTRTRPSAPILHPFFPSLKSSRVLVMVAFLSPSTHNFYLCLLYLLLLLLLLLLSSTGKVSGKTACRGSSSSSSSLDVVGSQTWRSIQVVRRRQQRQQPVAFARPYAGIFHRGSPTTRTCTCTALAIAANTLNLLLVRGGEHDQLPNANTTTTTTTTTNINIDFDDDKHVVYRCWSCLF